MPTFTRRAPATTSAPPAGTVPSPGTPLHLLPTGIPSLDDLFAGGIPLGGTWLVLAPDRHSAWGRLVSRYWIAQGLCSGQGSIVVGEAESAKELVEGCMWLDPRSTGNGSESEGEVEVGEGKGGKKIAWRYDGMSKFKTTVGAPPSYLWRRGIKLRKGSSNHLTLTKTIPGALLREMEKSGQQSYIPLDVDSGPSRGNWRMLEGVLGAIKAKLGKEAVRITICELGSMDWGVLSSREIHRFLHSLRAILKDSTASALVTLPSELARTPPKDWVGDTPSWIQSLSWSVDASVELRGFGDAPSLAPLYAPLHGLLTLHSFPTSHAVLPPTIRHSTLLGISTSASAGYGGGGAGENNLGFRCSRKRLEIETVHLGIEGGTGERRTEPVKDIGGVIAPGHSHATPASAPQAVAPEDAEGVDTPVLSVPPAPSGDQKPKKVRAKVRFGGPEVEVDGKPPALDHSHEQQHEHAGTRIRHDKPELYEF